MEDVFMTVIFLLILAAIGGFLYRYRFQIRKWCKDPKYGSAWYPSRETVLRRRIEDANAEMAWLEEQKEAEETKEE